MGSNSCFDGNLYGIADYGAEVAGTVIVKVINPSGNGNDIFVAFNAQKGINSGTIEAGNQVTVVQAGEGGNSYSESTLLSKMNAGDSYTSNSNFGGELKVEVQSTFTSGSGSVFNAEVKIYFGSECIGSPTPAPVTPTPPPTPGPVSPTPPPTPAPTNPAPPPPQIATYDATLEAPKCSLAWSCDSGDFLKGVGTIDPEPELNAPNSLNSCTDGSSGSYHSDESCDRIVVSRASSGGDGYMTEGEVVTITATVWCWSDGSEDFIDFYYASDAESPVWNQIGGRQSCPGGGEQTVTESYTLPQGSVQAVRVNIMYKSSEAADGCVPGGYNDVDDLVITVKAQPGAPTTSAPSAPPTPVPTSPPTATVRLNLKYQIECFRSPAMTQLFRIISLYLLSFLTFIAANCPTNTSSVGISYSSSYKPSDSSGKLRNVSKRNCLADQR